MVMVLRGGDRSGIRSMGRTRRPTGAARLPGGGTAPAGRRRRGRVWAVERPGTRPRTGVANLELQRMDVDTFLRCDVDAILNEGLETGL